MMNFEKFVEDIKTNNWNVFGVEVYADGKLLHSYGDTMNTKYPIYSATKTITSIAVGMAVDERLYNEIDTIQRLERLEIRLFRIIGNCSFWSSQKIKMPAKGRHNLKTKRFRKDKILLRRIRHRQSRLHLGNNPYQEGHRRSYRECPLMTFLQVDFSYIWL